MEKSDAQLGKPGTLYKETKANVEALASPAAGMKAFATDTKVDGYFNGSVWLWNDWSRMVVFEGAVVTFEDEMVWTY